LLLGESMAYIERSNLTSRLFNGRQLRKTLAFSKDVDCYRSAAIWSNLTRVCASAFTIFQGANGHQEEPQ
jgi:hypothetical protein